MIKSIQTNKAPSAIGPYSQAIEFNNLIFVSGQLGRDPASGELYEDIENQTRHAIKNIQNILKEADSDLEFVLKVSVYLKNISDFTAMNKVYSQFFKLHKPAREAVEVSSLPNHALIEISAVAAKK